MNYLKCPQSKENIPRIGNHSRGRQTNRRRPQRTGGCESAYSGAQKGLRVASLKISKTRQAAKKIFETGCQVCGTEGKVRGGGKNSWEQLTENEILGDLISVG